MSRLAVPKRIGTKPYAETLADDAKIKQAASRMAETDYRLDAARHRIGKIGGIGLERSVYRYIRSQHADGKRSALLAKDTPQGILDRLRLDGFQADEMIYSYQISW